MCVYVSKGEWLFRWMAIATLLVLARLAAMPLVHQNVGAYLATQGNGLAAAGAVITSAGKGS